MVSCEWAIGDGLTEASHSFSKGWGAVVSTSRLAKLKVGRSRPDKPFLLMLRNDAEEKTFVPHPSKNTEISFG